MPESTSSMAAPLPYSRKNPFLAELVRHDRLTRPGSLKDTRHFVLNLAGSGLTYTPGDSLVAFGRNSPAVVEELLATIGLDGDAMVTDPRGRPAALAQTLLTDYTINRANRKIMT